MNETSKTLITKINKDNIHKCEFAHSMEMTVITDLMIFDFAGGLWSPTSKVALI